MAKNAVGAGGNRSQIGVQLGFRTFVTALVTGGLFATASLADTRGGTSASIPVVPNPLPAPQSTNPAIWGWIGNEHILVSQGYINTLSGNNVTLTVAGRMSFGTTGGSRASSADDNQPLNGFNVVGTGPLAVWPYANSWSGNVGLLLAFDYPAYLQAWVDDTAYNVGYDAQKAIIPPSFEQSAEGPVLSSSYTVGANDLIRIDTKVKLLRSTARIEWKITNTDTVESHAVGLRFTVNQRSTENGIYFVNPEVGESRESVEWSGSRVPSSLEVFGRRAEASVSDSNNPPFHSRHIFRGLGATEPTRVYVADSVDLYPGEAAAPTDQYLPRPAGIRNTRFNSGIAVAAYYGGDTGYVLRPGESRTVVTYYGLGAGSENFDRRDVMVLGTEAPSALQYNADAANDPAVLGNTSGTLASIAPKFLTPNPFRIFASAYSQKPNDARYDVTFKGASLSLTLPTGLRLANVPGSGAPDVASKVISGGNIAGTITGDQEGSASWWVEPTGERFGPVAYQVALSVNQPSITMSVTRSLNIPSVPVVELLPNRFHMIGFPFTFHPIVSNNGDPDTIVNSLNRPDELNPIFYRWVSDPNTGGTTGRWVKATRLETGTSYFYRPTISTAPGKRTIFLKGAQPTPNQAPVGNLPSVPTQWTIEPGWNMVSNPYVYEIPLRTLRLVPLDSASLTPVPFTTAVSTGLVRGAIFFFNPVSGGYNYLLDLNESMKPWQGYWIYSNTRAELQFPAPTLRNSLVLPSAQNPSDLPGDAHSEPPTRKVATPTNWTLDLVARRPDGRYDSALTIGVGSGPSDSILKPPAFRDFVQTGIVEAGSEARFARLLRRSGNKLAWNVEVAGDTDESVTLTWPGINQLPRSVRVSLIDLATQRRIDLRSASSVAVPVRAGGVSRFRIEATTAATRRLAVAYLRPEGASRASGNYSYRLGLTGDATFSARIVTLGGVLVQDIASGRSAEAGGARIVWNGRRTDGALAPAGPYRLEVTATGPDGETVRDQRLITVVR